MRSRAWPIVVFAAYVVLAAVYTRPLLQQSSTQVASDPGDPILSTSVLWWNATTLPFSSRWWTPPFFYPNIETAALTENMVGISAVSSPVFWITGNAVTAYNIALFLTWPLSAFAVYLLVRVLTQREDAAIVAGVAFGFAPYRLAQLSHIPVLSAYWLPVALFALHAFLRDGRRRWLGLFGAAWLLQSLSNGYFIFFGGLLIGLWIVYFCFRRGAWRAVVPIGLTWGLASAPLVPVLLKYKTVHEHYGLSRSLNEIIAFSAQPWAWAQVSNLTWLWPHWLGDRGTETDLFPGVTAVALIAMAAFVVWRTSATSTESAETGVVVLRRLLAILAAVSAAASAVTVIIGPWRFDVAGVRVSMGGIGRAVAVAIVSGATAALLTGRARQALARRPELSFYTAATALTMVLACGPVIAYHDAVLLDPAPYRWLMRLPGFDELRVPARFWMVGTMCLSIAGGLAFARIVRPESRWRWLACGFAIVALLIEAWIPALPMAAVPERWPTVEHRDRSAAVLELPLGPAFDAAATFRSLVDRRPTVNGVSGYDPPAYTIVERGLNERDPAMLVALASFGPIDVVIDDASDPNGAIREFVLAAGARQISTDGLRTAYEIPDTGAPVQLGEPWPIRSATASADAERASLAIDGTMATQWQIGPQHPGEWLAVDLGEPRIVGGIVQAIGRDLLGYPRRLAIDVSLDGLDWREVSEGPTTAAAFLAAVADPRTIALQVTFDATSARFVRLRQVGSFEGGWTVAELRVCAPGRSRYP